METTNNKKTGKMIACFFCGKEFYVQKFRLLKRDRHYCQKICSNKGNASILSEKMKGKKHTEETKEKLRAYKGEKSSQWKGGKGKCPTCGVEILRKSVACYKHQTRYSLKEEHKQNISNALVGKMPPNLQREGSFMNIKRGWYNVNGKEMFFRSKWEVNYALYLDFLVDRAKIKEWFYEPETFIFHKIQFGTRSYLPDFKIVNKDETVEYHEIKGWLTPKSKTQIKRMAKYYPDVKLILIDRPLYREILKKFSGLVRFISKD